MYVKVIEVFNLKDFSRDNKLNHSCLSRMIRGDQGRRQHKGWRLHPENENLLKDCH